jgi:histidinol-phosphatase (PHP family)
MLLSLHGGHSGEFCNHASDTLDGMIKRYIELGFTHVGISEHLPPYDYNLMYDDEKECGLTPDIIFDRFESYIVKCNELKDKYKNEIKIFVGFETETYSGYDRFVPSMVNKYRPDYFVGSVHHINDLCFDSSKEHYKKAVDSCKSITDFYNAYFDKQYEMFLKIKPQVAGHFDLVRIFDTDYEKRFKEKSVLERIDRNLEVMKEYKIIMDYNQRALLKGMKEPYPSSFILKRAIDLGISIVPGDDSHDINTVGYKIKSSTDFLLDQGVEFDEEIFCNFY